MPALATQNPTLNLANASLIAISSPSSDLLGDHLDRSARAFLDAESAALAEVEIDLVELAGLAELDHGVVGADAVAVVAAEAVAARHAAARFVESVRIVEPADDLIEGGAAAGDLELRLDGGGSVGVVPGVELIEADDLALRGRLKALAAQPAVDVPRGLLAVADSDGDRALGGHHVAAREDALVPGRHVR